MEKRGISGTIVAILLILIAIAAIFLIYSVVKNFILSSSEKSEDTLVCLTDVNLEIVSSCYNGNVLSIMVRNNNYLDYESDFFKIQVSRNGNSVDIATQPMTLKGFEQKEFFANLDNPAGVDEFLFIPKIKQDKGYCYGQAIKFNPNQCV